MNTFFKANCIGIYLLAIASLATELPWGSGPYLQKIALLLLVVHALEVPFVLKHLKKYQGPLSVSVAQCLLFGFLHWLPLARDSQAVQTNGPLQ